MVEAFCYVFLDDNTIKAENDIELQTALNCVL